MTARKASRVHPKYKTKYCVTNWAEYERGLRARGSITVWFSEEVLSTWTPPPGGKRGAQRRYSDLAVLTAKTLGVVFHLPLRQVEGFVASLLATMGVQLDVPDHTTLSRRGRDMEAPVNARRAAGPIELIVDSTGLQVVGQGQWAAAKHGGKGKRGWRKFHVGVDADGFIVAQELTDSNVDDASVVPQLLEQIADPVERFTGDGAYDTWEIYQTMSEQGTTVVVPPSKTAVKSDADTPASRARNAAIDQYQSHGRRAWAKGVDYYQQGRAENTFSRYKRIIGPRTRGRHAAVQGVEVAIGCRVFNRMLALGAPASVRVEK